MGGKRRVKKIQMNTKSEQASSSSKKNQNEERMNKIENKKEMKKLKSAAEVESQEEVGVNESSINDLPPEMVMKILENLDVKSLLACRLVNRNWNVISNELFPSKIHPDIKISCFELNVTTRSENNTESGKRSLKIFLKLLENSNNFPFSRLLCQIKKSTFDQEDWTKFITDFGENIKCLKLLISYDFYYLKEIEEKLSVLLLSQLPNLQEFGLRYHRKYTRDRRYLIGTVVNRREELVSAGGLPRLKILHVDDCELITSSPFIFDLLHAALNLEAIEPFEKSEYFTLSQEVLLVLKSLGKLECLSAAQVDLAPDFLSRFKMMGPMPVKLKSLELNFRPIYYDPNLQTDPTAFLQNLFESSKDTLRELTTEPLGFLQLLQLPKLSKLTKLTIFKLSSGNRIKMNMNQILPSAINSVDAFPVLQTLVLEIPWTTGFIQADSTRLFPNLKTLKVTGGGISESTIAQISEMCPNLKNFEIHDKMEPIDNFPEVGKAIWTHMKQLESLKLRISVNTFANSFPAIDSCITGFSGEKCIQLYDLNKKTAMKLEKNPQSSEEEAERETESILDLKELRNLTVELGFSGIFRYQKPSREVAKKALTFISEEYALKLMDNLTYKIE